MKKPNLNVHIVRTDRRKHFARWYWAVVTESGVVSTGWATTRWQANRRARRAAERKLR